MFIKLLPYPVDQPSSAGYATMHGVCDSRGDVSHDDGAFLARGECRLPPISRVYVEEEAELLLLGQNGLVLISRSIGAVAAAQEVITHRGHIASFTTHRKQMAVVREEKADHEFNLEAVQSN